MMFRIVILMRRIWLRGCKNITASIRYLWSQILVNRLTAFRGICVNQFLQNHKKNNY